MKQTNKDFILNKLIGNEGDWLSSQQIATDLNIGQANCSRDLNLLHKEKMIDKIKVGKKVYFWYGTKQNIDIVKPEIDIKTLDLKDEKFEKKHTYIHKNTSNIPSYIKLEELLSKYKDETKTTRYLHKRIVRNNNDSGLIKIFLEFLQYLNEKGEI